MRHRGPRPGEASPERYVPPPTYNAHVVAWLIRERNAQLGQAKPRAPWAPVSLPPSLQGHTLGWRELPGRDDTDCDRSEAMAIAELRPVREDCDTDGDEDRDLSPENVTTSETRGVDTDADNDCNEREEPMKDELMVKVNRLREIDRNIGELQEERTTLAAEVRDDPGLVDLLALLGLGGKRAKRTTGPKPTTPIEKAAALPLTREGMLGPSRRDRMREVLRNDSKKSWRALGLAEAIGEPQNRQAVAQELADLSKRGEVEKLEPGLYRWRAA